MESGRPIRRRPQHDIVPSHTTPNHYRAEHGSVRPKGHPKSHGIACDFGNRNPPCRRIRLAHPNGGQMEHLPHHYGSTSRGSTPAAHRHSRPGLRPARLRRGPVPGLGPAVGPVPEPGILPGVGPGLPPPLRVGVISGRPQSSPSPGASTPGWQSRVWAVPAPSAPAPLFPAPACGPVPCRGRSAAPHGGAPPRRGRPSLRRLPARRLPGSCCRPPAGGPGPPFRSRPSRGSAPVPGSPFGSPRLPGPASPVAPFGLRPPALPPWGPSAGGRLSAGLRAGLGRAAAASPGGGGEGVALLRQRREALLPGTTAPGQRAKPQPFV